jgi:hypothetical protein
VHQSTARTDARRDIHLTVCNAKLYTLTVWEAAHARQQLSGYKGAAQRYSSPAMAVILLCVHMQFDAWIRDLLLLRCMAQLFELVFLEVRTLCGALTCKGALSASYVNRGRDFLGCKIVLTAFSRRQQPSFFLLKMPSCIALLTPETGWVSAGCHLISQRTSIAARLIVCC